MNEKSQRILDQLDTAQTKDLAESALYHMSDEDVIEIICNWCKADSVAHGELMAWLEEIDE